MSKNPLKLIAVSPENYQSLKDLGKAGDSFNDGAPQTQFNINSTSFGRVAYTYEPRRIQLGVRYLF